MQLKYSQSGTLVFPHVHHVLLPHVHQQSAAAHHTYAASPVRCWTQNCCLQTNGCSQFQCFKVPRQPHAHCLQLLLPFILCPSTLGPCLMTLCTQQRHPAWLHSDVASTCSCYSRRLAAGAQGDALHAQAAYKRPHLAITEQGRGTQQQLIHTQQVLQVARSYRRLP